MVPGFYCILIYWVSQSQYIIVLISDAVNFSFYFDPL